MVRLVDKAIFFNRLVNILERLSIKRRLLICIKLVWALFGVEIKYRRLIIIIIIYYAKGSLLLVFGFSSIVNQQFNDLPKDILSYKIFLDSDLRNFL